VKPTALIAEDEPLLAMALRAELGRAWPELEVLATVGDGLSAVKQALALQPDVLFFDIRMPGLDGLDAAAELADAWPTDGNGNGNATAPVKPFPQLVFTTAYDQYAVRAFEVHAVDYLLKPIQADRLQKAVDKLKQALGNAAPPASSKTIANNGADSAADAVSAPENPLEQAVQQLRALMQGNAVSIGAGSGTPPSPKIRVIQASVGSQIHMVPVEDVIYFEAADKYLRVLTAEREYLIRTPLKELLPQLDEQLFWQIHRSTVVRASAIAAVSRDEAGKQHISLHGSPDKLAVSRIYAHLFKPM
jgi:DNA-binding LytR/AlgR family response regulator